MSAPPNSLIPQQTQRVSPVDLLRTLCEKQVTGSLWVASNGVNWLVVFEQGRVIYVTHDLEPLVRLGEQLQRQGGPGSVLAEEVRPLINTLFAQKLKEPASGRVGYEALLWLMRQQYLTREQALEVCERLTREALESLLLVSEGAVVFSPQTHLSQTGYSFELSALLTYCQERIRGWRALGAPVWSPYQRLYLTSHVTPQKQLPELHQQFRVHLRGLSFRHLAIQTNYDELKLAQSLLPYIREKVILLREPQPPFHQLPRLLPLQPIAPPVKPACTIACIDDSPTITNEIRRYLGDTGFEVIAVNEPLKALMQIVRLKPELILLDVGMPLLDGYELCRLLRKNPLFKKTPIVMVTGNTGFLDRAKATMVGATDYLTKPFSQEGLLKMVHRHLAV
ncbi:response regulator [Anthocerotibacter panamensis]|uniref:response regulator n=1 Tax=Anthocerotibacter panamensis TaxID=2857077 RepID=UPI001C404821|nr:response regulator [Anthocerotibacter panamensis]